MRSNGRDSSGIPSLGPAADGGLSLHLADCCVDRSGGTGRAGSGYESGDLGGITISRRPNKRPSIEKAPGPSKPIPAAVTTTSRTSSGAANIANGGPGNQENAIPNKHSPMPRLAKGVRNPITKATPPMINTEPMTHTAAACSILLERYRAPKVIASPPSAARTRSSPIPGLPPGKVENSLCRGKPPPCAKRNSLRTKLHNYVAGGNPSLRDFSLPLSRYSIVRRSFVRGG